MPVLLVDDDRDLIDVLTYILRREGYEVTVAYDGEQGWERYREESPELVVLDANMPGIDGMELCRRIREVAATPVIMLTARTDEADVVRALGLGADDYITKPFSPRQLVARVKAVLRRSRRGEAPPAAVLDFGRLAIDVRAREVRVDGRSVALPAREFDLLQHFAEHPRQVFTREQLLERFWDGFGDPHTLTVHVGRIREKIEEDPAHPRLIVTVWGVGYRFEGARR